MQPTSNLARVAAAAILFAASGAHAGGTVTPELGWGQISGGHVYHVDNERRQTGSVDVALGYRWDNGLGIRGLYIGAFDIAKVFFVNDSPPTFNDFYAVQATGALPLANRLNLTGGLGVGRVSLNRGTPGDHEESAEGVVSAGLQWRPATHFALELHVDYLSRTHERNIALMAQVPF